MADSTQITKPDEEFSDPYTIHHSDHTRLILVSNTLDGNNYGQCSRAMCMGLSAKNKIGFIDGTIKAPPLLDTKYTTWKRCNDMVTLWIVNSVHSDIVTRPDPDILRISGWSRAGRHPRATKAIY
ncbi:hypothetical protein ACFX11_036472 [Malus domestica]